MRMISHRIADPRVLRLIAQWLRAGVMEGTEWHETVVRAELPIGGDDRAPIGLRLLVGRLTQSKASPPRTSLRQ